MKASALHDYEFNPSGWSASGREPPDFCSREGALALKEKIEAYWRERGHHVMVSLQNVGFHPAIRAARYDLRTDMVNGLPRANKAKTGAPVSARDCFVDNEEEGDWSED